VPVDLMPFFDGPAATLAVALILCLVIIAVVVFAAVFSKKASRRRAALAVLGLLIARLKPFGRRLPPED
jgi:hypothetical protein